MAFKCYNCEEKRPDKELGAVMVEKKICAFCSSFVDEGYIAGLIRFDSPGSQRRKYRIRERNK